MDRVGWGEGTQRMQTQDTGLTVPANPGRRGDAPSIGELAREAVLLVLVVLLIPVAILLLGTPAVLLVRLVIATAQLLSRVF